MVLQYSEILRRFPSNLKFVFAYGSAIKRQANADSRVNRTMKKMIDLVLVTDSSREFHRANLALNPNHYSFLKVFGTDAIDFVHRRFAAKVYFNSLIDFSSEYFLKYGVIEKNDLIEDLIDWPNLYIAGRLHKPVEILKNCSDTDLNRALDRNLKSAVHIALLILPDEFDEYQFYHTICSLSYEGDFRMIFGENPNKVRNILKYQLTEFRNIYRPFLDRLHAILDIEPDSNHITNQETQLTENDLKCIKFTQNKSEESNLIHLMQIPRQVYVNLQKQIVHNDWTDLTDDWLLKTIAGHPECSAIVREAVRKIVFRSSWKQSLKGLLTAGLRKSLRYSFRKLEKMMDT